MRLTNIPDSYYPFVAELAKDGDKIIAELTADRIHLVHMALGITGEVNEVREVLDMYFKENFNWSQKEFIDKLTDELGDVLFYITGCANATGIGCAVPETKRALGSWDELYQITAEFTEYVKKLVIYNREWDEAVLQRHIINMYIAVEATANMHGIPVYELIASNRNKLGKRYKGGYSDAKANNKADKRGES